MMNPMRLSIIMPCHNAASTIGEALDALARQEWEKPWEILVVDNRSTDGSSEIVERYRARMPNVRLIHAYACQGQPYALNVGVDCAAGESVALCDADDVPGDGYVPAIGEALEKFDFVACRIDLLKLNSASLAAARGFPQYSGLQNFSYPPFLPHAGGGTLGVKRRLWQWVGGVDPSLPVLHDTDLCWKLQLAGIPLTFLPHAVMHVRLRHDARGNLRQAASWGAANVALYTRYRKHGMPRLTIRGGFSAWLQLLRQARHYRRMDPGKQAAFMWQLGWRYGRVKGSIRQRVFAL